MHRCSGKRRLECGKGSSTEYLDRLVKRTTKVARDLLLLGSVVSQLAYLLLKLTTTFHGEPWRRENVRWQGLVVSRVTGVEWLRLMTRVRVVAIGRVIFGAKCRRSLLEILLDVLGGRGDLLDVLLLPARVMASAAVLSEDRQQRPLTPWRL